MNAAFLAMVAMVGLLFLGMGLAGWGLPDEVSSFKTPTVWLARAGATLGAFVPTYLLTGWPVLGAYAGALAFFAPVYWHTFRRQKRYIARLNGLADWLDRVRDSLGASAGLEQSLLASTDRPPEEIADELHRLRLNLQHRPTVECLATFADDLQMPAGDQAVAALILATSSGAGRLVPMLSKVSTLCREQISTARSIEAGRADLRSQANAVTAIVLVVVVGLIIFRREELAAYDSFDGQVALALVLGFLVGGVLAFHRMAMPQSLVRPLDGVGRAYGQAPQPESAAAQDGDPHSRVSEAGLVR